MRVRNAKACHVSLSRFGKMPTGGTLAIEIESVSIAPGATQDVDDEFLASEGAQGLIADGTLAIEIESVSIAPEPEAGGKKGRGAK